MPSVIDQLVELENAATKFGFKWERADQIKQQIISELAEIDVHLQDKDREKLQEELGDLLHAVFSLTVFCGFDAETTLKNAVEKFEKRFNAVKRVTAQQGLNSLNGQPFEKLMEVWDEAKK